MVKANLTPRIPFLLSILALVTFASVALNTQSVSGQQSKPTNIREEKSHKAIGGSAPTECLTFARGFIAYIFQKTPDLGEDKAGQQRWLSQNLQKGLAHRQETYREHVKENPDTPEQPPGNRDFVGSWDYPTAYSILGSRRYGNRAVVDLEFRWGVKTNYPGDRRLVSYILVNESGWKLDDVYIFQGEFTGGAHSLSSEFQRNTFP